MIKLHIANITGDMDKLLTRIKSAHKKAAKTVSDKLDLNKVDVIFVADPSKVIKEVGIGGFTPNRHLVYVYIDPEFDVTEDEIYATLCHELSHARRYDGEGYGTTLFDSMIFEGIATAFEKEATKGKSFVVKEIESRSNTDKLFKYAEGEFSLKSFNYYRWFIQGDAWIPRWAGYEIGYYVVREYMKKTHKKASELILEASSSFN